MNVLKSHDKVFNDVIDYIIVPNLLAISYYLLKLNRKILDRASLEKALFEYNILIMFKFI